MRRIIYIITLILSASSFGQAQKTTTLSLSVVDCRENHSFPFFGMDTINVYKLPEDTLIASLRPRKSGTSPINLENMPIGDYTVIYTNSFHQLVKKRISLADQKINPVALCPDSLSDYPQNTLAKLQDKEVITINFFSQGCFDTEVMKLTIIKEDTRFVARLYKISWIYTKKKRQTVMKYTDSTLIDTRTLTEKNIQDFIRFENELNYVKDGTCTTTDLYAITSKYLMIEKRDGACSWNGFYYLRKNIFSK